MATHSLSIHIPLHRWVLSQHSASSGGPPFSSLRATALWSFRSLQEPHDFHMPCLGGQVQSRGTIVSLRLRMNSKPGSWGEEKHMRDSGGEKQALLFG